MSPLVLPEMVRSHELSAALVTFMWSVFGVYPSMSSKFIRTEEGPSTGFPHAFIGPFTWGNDKGEKEFRGIGQRVGRKGSDFMKQSNQR